MTPANFPALKRLFFPVLAGAAALALTLSAARAAEPRVAVSGNAAPQARLRAARLLGRVAPETALRAGLLLPLRSQSELDDLLRRQYTPGDPQFHQFLTPAEFTRRFGPTAADYDAVAAYARSQGLTVTATSPSRTLLSVQGPAAKIEAAFGVQMGRYRMPDGHVGLSSSAAPTLPRSVAARVAGIAGLSSLARMTPHLRRLPHAPVPVTTGGSGIGSGPLGGLSPNDIKYAYGLSGITPLYGTTAAAPAGALTGAGQNIGLFELDGFAASDIALYASTFSLPTALTGAAASVTALPVGASKGLIETVEGRTEVTLDIDMILALAPAATGIYVYEDSQGTVSSTGTVVTAGDPVAPLTIFNRMATDLNPTTGKLLIQVISCSWGINETQEDPAIISGENTVFQQFAAQGQSLFCSSGDNGAYDAYASIVSGTTVISTGLTSPVVDNPASQPYATGVGGTTLAYKKPGTTTAGVATAGAYLGETVWSAGTPSVSPEGSGGGISTLWAKPAYQAGVGVSPLRREVPDVALNADPNTGYSVFVGGTAEIIGGTSASAPLWAAYTALINQQRVSNGLGSVGFLNPLLYPIAAGSAYAAQFNDVVSGTNLFYQAGPGYDDATGLGSFKGAALLAALSLNANQGTGTATVSGIVTTASAPPTPIAGATVTAVSTANSAVVGTATTDATGAYTLSVPSGLALKITVTTGTVTAPAGVAFSGTAAALSALSAGGSAAQSFTLTAAQTFPAGVQMISAPYDFTGVGDFAALFGLAAGSGVRLVQYSPLQNSYLFYPAPPADTLRLGQGYWVRFPAATSLKLTGTPAPATAAFSIPLQQGWNQIGDPFPLPAPLSGISVAGGGLLSASTTVQPLVFAYNTTTGKYVTLSVASDSLAPFTGYWIYAFQPAALSVPPPAGTVGPPPAPITPPGL